MEKTQKAIACLFEQQEAAEDFGFVWDNISQLVHHARSECDEIEDALKTGDKAKIADEIGDLMRAAVTLCCVTNLDVTELLEKGNRKFQRRFDVVKTIAQVEGFQNLKGLSYEERLTYWVKAKRFNARK